MLGCVGPGSCPTALHSDDTFPLDDTDPVLAPLIADCEQQQSCEALCTELYTRMYQRDNVRFEVCELVNAPDNKFAIHAVADTVCLGGRRPGNFGRGVSDETCNAVARYLARQAELEGASVRAFADLHADLVALDAPATLRRAVIRAAADEVRHAATCSRLARRFGGRAPHRAIAAAPRRDPLALALDNATEGCVRETYGAAVAGYQARAAGDPPVRRAMYRLARDEARHAALAWRIQRWLAPRLAAADRIVVAEASARARTELAAEATTDAVTLEPSLQRTLGLPPPAAASAMLASLAAQVWSSLARHA